MKFLRPWLLIPLVAALLGTAAIFSTTWRAIELRGFDWLTVVTAPGRSALPITIVGIDEASFAQIGQRWPWSRAMHAKLTEKLVQGGAAVVFFDLVFSEKSSISEDAAFADAIKAAGNVVLASDHAYQETASLRQWIRVDPLPEFIKAGAVSGLTSATIDGDAVMRKFPDAQDILWRQVIQVLQRQRPDLGLAGDIPPRAMVRHLGPAHTFPYVSFYQVLNGDSSIPADFFKDQIVLIGRDVRASPDVGSAQSDLFATPFLGQSQLMTPGVEIHATLIENALTNRAIAPLSNVIGAVVLAGLMLLAMPAFWRWHPWWSGAWITLLGATTLFASYWLFLQWSQWLPVLAELLSLLLAYVGMGLNSFLEERRRASQIKGTFSKYVASQVVEQMIANPDLVRLGGERRELTLLFTDLAGFTSMSERLSPENVAHVINLYLTEMTRIIIKSGGTVDKFIGDAVMAFWGAPLDDELHGLHGVLAAVDMQLTMDRLQTSFAAMGAGKVALRIGVHSGPAIVGNMGSEERFDYTALGDTVNLAARLEGVNKFYGTRILLSGSTAKLLNNTLPLRLVDSVRVKGKAQPVDILTPCEDSKLIALTNTAIQAYKRADWSAAKVAWNAVQTYAPNDTLAPVFLSRITGFENTPPVDWDGSVSLEKG